VVELLQPTNPISHEVDWERFPLLIHSSAPPPPPFPQQQTWGIGGTLKDVYIKLAMNGGAGQVVVLPVLAMVIFGYMMSTEPSQIHTHSEILTVFLQISRLEFAL
jgi:hypothetical protein